MDPLHRKLLGTWKSDKRKTLRNIPRYHKLPLKTKRRLGALFGKLVVRHTKRFVYVSLDDWHTRERYEVVATAKAGFTAGEIIVIRTSQQHARALLPTGEFAKSQLSYIQFCERRGKQYYSVACGNWFSEWFVKID